MQQVTCPNCGEMVRAENINIQQMVAVCQNCDTVFKFDAPNETEKAKRRKVKKPQQMTLDETPDKLELAFQTNFRLDRDEVVMSSIIVAVVFTVLTFIMLGEFLSGELALFLPSLFASAVIGVLYRLGLRVYNRTHIEMDNERIRVSRQPLPNFLAQPLEVNLSGVVAIRTEETEVSIKEGYDTPRYRVWAETADGSRRTIVTDVTEDYAYFITQRLDERLQMGTDTLNTARLEDYQQDEEAEIISLHEMMESHEEMDQQ